ncbi:MAG: hypothetical protein H7326_06470 [Bdellovibrionaceae bacterium]|nr:hypothetical protein [Pseudobdellovibrionaceae bacterium]
MDHTVEHPGKAFCKFIYIGIANDKRLQYLEFIHVGRGGVWKDLAGISYRAASSLQKMSATNPFQKLKAVFRHKNYDWKNNSVDRLPGWNFVNFPKHNSNIYTWLTEYEDAPRLRRIKKLEYRHPNRVFKVVAIESSLNEKDKKLYSALFGHAKNNMQSLLCKTIFSALPAKKSKLESIVLATKDLKSLIKKFEWDELTVYEGQPAVRIKNPNAGMWDVLIVQQ